MDRSLSAQAKCHARRAGRDVRGPAAVGAREENALLEVVRSDVNAVPGLVRPDVAVGVGEEDQAGASEVGSDDGDDSAVGVPPNDPSTCGTTRTDDSGITLGPLRPLSTGISVSARQTWRSWEAWGPNTRCAHAPHRAGRALTPVSACASWCPRRPRSAHRASRARCSMCSRNAVLTASQSQRPHQQDSSHRHWSGGSPRAAKFVARSTGGVTPHVAFPCVDSSRCFDYQRQVTIIIAMNQGTFAVLGADQLTSSAAGAERPSWLPRIHTKVVLHPTLPLAAACMGLAVIPHPSNFDALTNVYQELKSVVLGSEASGNWTLEQFASGVADRLHPSVLHLERTGQIDLENPLDRLDLWFVAAPNGSAAAVCARITRTIEITSLARGKVHPAAPDHLFPAWDRMTSMRDIMTSQDRTPYTCALMTSRLLDETIAYEAKSKAGEGLMVGGGTDVVVVDAKGARLWHPGSRSERRTAERHAKKRR